MNQIKEPAKRKRDFVTLFAIFLFVILIVFELLLVTVLPSRLRNEEIWSQAVTSERVVRDMDRLRGEVTGYKISGTFNEGERKLVKNCLDDLARYLRNHSEDIPIDYLTDIEVKLREFKHIYRRWRNEGFYSTLVTLNSKRYIDTLLVGNGIIIEKSGKKNDNGTPE